MQDRLKTNEKLHRLRGLLRLRTHAAEVGRLAGTLEQARIFVGGVLKQLESALARLPRVTSEAVSESWRKLDRSLKDDCVRLEAMGLRVRLLPDAAGGP